MNPIKGIIYTPSGRAREYSDLACNIYQGDCEHRCVYCYVPGMRYRKRGPLAEREDFLERLTRQAASLQRKDVSGRVLLCFTTDPYQPFETERAARAIPRKTIEILHAHGFNVQTLTKGGTRSLCDLDLFGPDDAYAATLTLLDNKRSRRWEPKAALPQDRIEALQIYHSRTFVWISLEPVIDPAVSLEIIRRTADFVDHYKVGMMNHTEKLPATFAREVADIDWQAFAIDAVELLESIGVDYYIKKSLRAYLPPELITAANSTPPVRVDGAVAS